jgi:hypothetical protein
MADDIDTPVQYRQTLQRCAALRAQCAAIRSLQAQASADRFLGHIEAADLRDLAGLDDVLADIGYTLRGLEAALADWETAESYGTADDPAADRAWHRRRS